MPLKVGTKEMPPARLKACAGERGNFEPHRDTGQETHELDMLDPIRLGQLGTRGASLGTLVRFRTPRAARKAQL